MGDPAVCSFLTKTLCSQGGRLALPEFQQLVGLSAQQLEETLSAAGPRQFLVVRCGGQGDRSVLAVSDVRVCARKDCGGCEQLHLCKRHLLGKCGLGSRSCKYSHDILSAENKKVLKSHGLSYLNENDLQVLLLQNDPFFLPDACQYYNRKDEACIHENNCDKLHICRYFLRGECRFFPCKKSHNLSDAHALALLQNAGIGQDTVSNIQTIYDHRNAEFYKELQKGKIQYHGPREKLLKKPADRSKEPKVLLQTMDSVLQAPPSEVLFIQSSRAGPNNKVPDQSQHQLPTGAGGKDKDKKDDSSAKALKGDKGGNCDEICVFHVWKYCKNKDKCRAVHYHLPYRWQVYNGITWNDLPMMEEIEKAYCDPKISSMPHKSINFTTMTCASYSLRRLCTPSSVTKPTFVLTTQWIWYWKNDQGQWIEYEEQGGKNNVTAPSSAVIENLYLADPDTTISFQSGVHHYELNFKEMIQTNILYKTRRQVCRRPKFVSSEDVQKIKKGQRDFSIPNQACPIHWDPSALPEWGYKVYI
ncbi:PAR12 polymerase, partial [Jacana jacana]|nr:PAR12 polymerase [Jacana jacana]